MDPIATYLETLKQFEGAAKLAEKFAAAVKAGNDVLSRWHMAIVTNAEGGEGYPPEVVAITSATMILT
jgi:hypothetical protein